MRLRAARAAASRANTNAHAKLVSGKLKMYALTNSRGSLMTHRMPGETLAIRDKVAMTPTVQPAAAGTHQYRDVRRVKVTVIGREDIRLTVEMGVTGYQTGPVYFSPGPWPGSSGATPASRNANCSVFSPSRTGPA